MEDFLNMFTNDVKIRSCIATAVFIDLLLMTIILLDSGLITMYVTVQVHNLIIDKL